MNKIDQGEQDHPETIEDDNIKKKARHRKKHLYNSILQQMEFYFSDSNLAKDRYLSQVIQENPNVNLSIFMKFNKIKKLTTNVDEIRKALRNSELLGISEDGETIFRKTPVKARDNVDDCTIYVEKIKADASHEWIQSVFADFGHVVYVSIPKYKKTRLNKGFAFIEFETEMEAQKAIKYFESIGSKMPSHLNPEELCSIATFEKDDADGTVATGVVENKQKEETNVEDNSQDKNSKKRKRSTDNVQSLNKKLTKNKKKTNIEDESEEAETSVKQKSSTDNNESRTEKSRNVNIEGISEEETASNSTDIVDDSQEKASNNDKRSSGKVKKPNKKGKSKTENESEEEASKCKPSTDHDVDEVEKTKKENKTDTADGVQEETSAKRKRSTETDEAEVKKLKTDDELDKGATSISDAAMKRKKKKEQKKKNHVKELGLQVLSKKEWKKMRNHYLDTQRKKMKEFKKYLNNKRFSQQNYGDKNKEPTESTEQTTNQGESRLEFIPGVIVKVKLSEPCADAKKLKNDIKSTTSEAVKYVEASIGSEEVYIRFGDSTSAQEFSRQDGFGEKTLLQSNEEKQYWWKIQKDRTTKFNKESKKERGRDKLLKKAQKEVAKHIKFDEESGEAIKIR